MLLPLPNFKGAPLLITHQGILTQTLVDSMASARAADIYGFTGISSERNTTLLGIAKLITEFARICNFTPKVVLQQNIQSGLINESQFIGMISPYTIPKTISACCTPLIKSHASITLTLYMYFNFVYCDIERELQQTNFQVLLQPFGNLIWIILLTTMVLMTVCLSKTMRIGISLSVFVTIGSVFSIASVTNNKWKSTLFSLWLVGCLVINNMYSGVLTSLLISPAGQDVMKAVDDLVKRDYRLLYIPQGYFKNIQLMIQGMVDAIAAAGVKQTNSNNSSVSSSFNQSMMVPHKNPVHYMSIQKNSTTTLEKLFISIENKKNLSELVNALAFQPKVALFGPYLLIMMYWIILTEKNQQEYQRSRNKNTRRYCHMGKVLSSMYSVPEMWIFKMNPEITTITSHDMATLFYRLEENGIHVFWMSIFFQLQTSNRAQDVHRFKTRTEAKEDVPVEPLGFHKGNVYIIFIVYIICVLICGSVFLSEIILNRVYEGVHSTEPILYDTLYYLH
ncbi:unnamed protein product [Orchesella dallaii]|uniref:Uncharacterized protein n=1 Tax=Orchesella dallaii TaxID=48710 RepID=A0ABP1Q6Z4_9HEXA